MNLTRPALAASSSGLGFFGLWCCSTWPSDSTYFNILQVHRMGRFHTIKTRQKSDDFEAPDAINWPTPFFFWGKIILTVIADCALLYSIGEQLLGLQRLVRPHWRQTAATRASRKSLPRSRRNRIDKLRREFVRYRRLLTRRRVLVAICFG